MRTPVARFKYDARNRKIARWDASIGDWTYFVYGLSGELLSEVKRTGNAAQPWAPVRDYVWLDGSPVAQVGVPRPRVPIAGPSADRRTEH